MMGGMYHRELIPGAEKWRSSAPSVQLKAQTPPPQSKSPPEGSHSAQPRSVWDQGKPKPHSLDSHMKLSTFPAASTRWTSEREEVPGRGTCPIPSHPVPPALAMPSGGGSESGQASPSMEQHSVLWLVALLWLALGAGGSSSCWDPRGQPRRCMPVFENAAFGRAAQATNTCGSPPEEYCLQMGARHTSALCHRCDASDARHHHNASFLTDFHSQEESTWWQSQSMAFGIQHPNSVNITLHLGKCRWEPLQSSMGSGCSNTWVWMLLHPIAIGAGSGLKAGCSPGLLGGVRREMPSMGRSLKGPGEGLPHLSAELWSFVG